MRKTRYKEGDMKWICNDNKFSIWYICLVVTKVDQLNQLTSLVLSTMPKREIVGND